MCWNIWSCFHRTPASKIVPVNVEFWWMWYHIAPERKKHLDNYSVTLPLPLPLHSSTYPHPLFLCSEKGKSWLVHLHYNTNAISPASTFLICLSYIYFIFPSFYTHATGNWCRICAWNFGFVWGEWAEECVCLCVRVQYVCGPACFYQGDRHNL